MWSGLFSAPYQNGSQYYDVGPLCPISDVGVVSGLIEEVLLEAHVVQRTSCVLYSRDARYVNGLPNYTLKTRENIKIDESKMVKMNPSSTKEMSNVDFFNFIPGSIICFKSVL